MIKKARILIVILFIAAAVVFFANRSYEKRTSDFIAPAITAESDKLEASVGVTDEELLQGMTATDNLEGDVTGTLVVASRSKFIRPNVVKIHYAAFDKNNNVGTFTRELTYTDYVSPRFYLKAPLCYIDSANRDASQILNSLYATDCIDGDLTQQIMVTQGDTEQIGEGVVAQNVTLQVSNRTGDTTVLNLRVRFEDYNVFNQLKPHLKNYLIYHKADQVAPSLLRYVDGIGYGNKITSLVDMGFTSADVRADYSSVDFKTPGVYEATFTLTKLLENGARQDLGTSIMIVIVED